MSAEADRAALVQLWMQQADDELVAARHLASDFEVPDRIAAFHLAAEKALKAVTILRAVPVRKEHELAKLAVLLPPADIAGMDRADFDLLEPWSIEGRYPADLPDQGPRDVVRLLEAAARVVEAVKRVVRGAT